MGAFAVGDVVLILFPYDGFTKSKRRPALVVGTAKPNSLILCQITATGVTPKHAYDAKEQTVTLYERDFRTGGLGRQCYVRLDRLFTADQAIVVKTLGSLMASETSALKQRLRMLFG